MSIEQKIAALEAELARLKELLAGSPPPPPAPVPSEPERVALGQLAGYWTHPSWVWGAVGLLGLLPDEALTLSPQEARRVAQLASLAAERGRWEAALEALKISPPPVEVSLHRLAGLRPHVEAHARALLEAVEARQDIPEPVRKMVADALAAFS